MNTNNNPPSLLSLLRTIAESGRTQRIIYRKSNPYSSKHIVIKWLDEPERWVGWNQESDEGKHPFGVEECAVVLFKIKDGLIQIAKENNIRCVMLNNEVVTIHAPQKAFEKYGVSSGDLENITHAIAFGLCEALSLEVKDD
jgi:hypothetical protein